MSTVSTGSSLHRPDNIDNNRTTQQHQQPYYTAAKPPHRTPVTTPPTTDNSTNNNNNNQQPQRRRTTTTQQQQQQALPPSLAGKRSASSRQLRSSTPNQTTTVTSSSTSKLRTTPPLSLSLPGAKKSQGSQGSSASFALAGSNRKSQGSASKRLAPPRSRTSNRSSGTPLLGSVGGGGESPHTSPLSEHPAVRAARRNRKERRQLKGLVTCCSHFSEICQTNCSVYFVGAKDHMLNFVQNIFKPSGYKKQKPQELVKQMADELESLPDVIEETANTNSVTGMTVSLSTSKSFHRSTSLVDENETKKYAPLEDFLAAAVIPMSGSSTTADHKPDNHAGPPTQFGSVTSTRKPPKPEEIEKVINQSLQSNLLLKIARHIAVASPELRRSCVQVWGHLLKLESPKTHDKVNLAYLMTHPDCMRCLISCYSIPDCSIHVGVMIRDACKFHDVVQSQMFNSGLIYQLFDVLHSHNFDTQADGFETLKEVLMNHKDVSVRWLLDNFDEFFDRYQELLDASSSETQYVTVRQSLKLLGDILLDRPFMKVMVRFVNEERYLKSVMILLGNSSKAVQVEAFHVFKIFAANPHKAPAVQQILYQNKTRLIKLLNQLEMVVISSTGVHKSQSEEKQFVADKQAVVNKLEKLTMPEKIGHHSHQQQRDSSSASPESDRQRGSQHTGAAPAANRTRSAV